MRHLSATSRHVFALLLGATWLLGTAPSAHAQPGYGPPAGPGGTIIRHPPGYANDYYYMPTLGHRFRFQFDTGHNTLPAYSNSYYIQWDSAVIPVTPPPIRHPAYSNDSYYAPRVQAPEYNYSSRFLR